MTAIEGIISFTSELVKMIFGEFAKYIVPLIIVLVILFIAILIIKKFKKQLGKK